MAYLHIGMNVMVEDRRVIGIFDLDIPSQSHLTRKYLTMAEKAGEVVNASEDIPKSFVVCRSGNKKILYLSQMASATLLKRAESGLL